MVLAKTHFSLLTKGFDSQAVLSIREAMSAAISTDTSHGAVKNGQLGQNLLGGNEDFSERQINACLVPFPLHSILW